MKIFNFFLLAIYYLVIFQEDVLSSDYYYYYFNEKIPLYQVADEYGILFKKSVLESKKYNLFSNLKSDILRFDNRGDLYNLVMMKGKNTISLLEKSLLIRHISDVYEFEDGSKCIVPNRFIVQFKKDIDKSNIDDLCKKHGVSIIIESEDFINNFILEVNDRGILHNTYSLEYANIFNELPEVEYSTPDFLIWGRFFLGVVPNDPLFNNQWHLSKVDASEAWSISKGSSTNVVAILDTGCDLDHEDLSNRYFRDGSNNIIGEDFTSQGDNSPSPSKNNPHGTACAGLVAAETNNGIGVAGYNWHCKIMPLQVTYNYTDINGWPDNDMWSPSWTGDAINYAKNNDASILSMSFTQNVNPYINSAIQNAAINGRNGKGCIIIASSGNNGSAVNYPANLDDYVIAVGSTDENDDKWAYSSYGPELDLMAPSGLNAGIVRGNEFTCDIPGLPKVFFQVLMRGNIWTTDLSGVDPVSGDYGYHDDNCYFLNSIWPGGSDGKYTGLFSGTSAAAPQVAGLASLILSINQDLTRTQVQEILQNSADKVTGMGGQNRTDQYGYGRINAYKALKYSIEYYEINNVFSGNISSNTTWSGYKYVIGNVTVNSGVNLTIEPGTFVLFKDNTKLIVNGILDVNGNSSEKVKFTSINQSPVAGDWNGIEINGSADIDNCTIEYAAIGVKCNGSLPNIRNNLISDNNIGIYLVDIGITTTSIRNNDIRNNDYYGIYLYNSSPFIGYNNIQNNNYYGIYCYRSHPSIHHNDITGHSSSGIYCNYYSPAYLSYFSTGPGSNLITNNYRGVYANYQCNAFIYWNDIYSNYSYEVDAYQPLFIDAEYNWWGAYPPDNSEFNATSGATIDYTPSLDEPVRGGKSQTSGGDIVLNNADCSYWDGSLDFALQYQQAEKYDQAIEIYEQIVKSDLNSEKGRYALVRLDECYRLSAKKGFISYLDNYVRPKLSTKDDLFGVTLELENHWRLDGGEYKTALKNLELLRTDFSANPVMEKYALFNAGLIHLIYLDNRLEAEKVFYELESKHPDDPLVMDSKIMLGNFNKSALNKSITNRQDYDLTPEEFSISQNYPNPFNPTTHIQLDLPEGVDVKLEVFNIRGQKVATLVDGYREAGSYEVLFDGRRLASGVYFYRVITPKFTAIKRMLLVK